MQLAAARGVAALREPIAALAAAPSEPPALRGAALEALPALGPAPSASLLEAALASDAPELRAAAVAADPAPSAARLSRLAARDGSAAVREAALRRLASLPAEQSLSPILAAFEDPDPRVREAAIQAAAGLGEAAVPALAERALAAPAERARAPIAALALAGPAGTLALTRVAQDHTDEQIRALARVLRPPRLSRPLRRTERRAGVTRRGGPARGLSRVAVASSLHPAGPRARRECRFPPPRRVSSTASVTPFGCAT